MVAYRLYFLSSDDHISRALDLECENDERAVEEARLHLQRGALELWQGARRVTRLTPDDDA